jgi:predicted ATP-grasp superfamily ATP-dependent carboligase
MRPDKDRVFLFEYATCTNESMPPRTAVEGYGMFKTLFEGFENPISFYNVFDYLEAFKEHLEKIDFALAIAPETDMELHKLTQLIEESGCMNLGCTAESVRLTSDKLLTYGRLKDLTPKTEIFTGKTRLDFPVIAKPRDGVSCEGVMVIENEDELEKVPSGYLLQEYVRGRPMSASVLVGDTVHLLSINTQEITDFKYTGAKLPVNLSSTEEIVEAVQRVPGLFGYVGVDFIMASDGPSIIEINPRPTTPIIGLNAAMRINTSALILNNCKGKIIPEIKPNKRIQVKKIRSNSGYVSCDGYSMVIEEINEDTCS